MPRLISASLTTDQVRNRTKTVTRRLGWRNLKPGDRLTVCTKVMGRHRKDGTVEPLERLAEVEVVSARREPLDLLISHPEYAACETTAEGFPHMTGLDFVAFFCEHMQCDPSIMVTRIEWRYLDVVVEAQP